MSSWERKMMEYKCVRCGFKLKTLYVQYSPGNIRLMKCENCKAVADEYIECEFMIVLIDLILHKPEAYRHVLYNVINHESASFKNLLWKLACGFLLLDAYRSLLLRRNEGDSGSSSGHPSTVLLCQEVFRDVMLGNFVFFFTILVGTRIFLGTSISIYRWRDLILPTLVSSYFKVFLLTMMVWEFPSSVIFIIDLFVLSSNAVALQVTTDSVMGRCTAVCLCAHALKLLVTQVKINVFYPWTAARQATRYDRH